MLIRGLCKKKRMVYANKLFAKQTISINTLQKLYTNVEDNIKLTAQVMLNADIIDYLFIYKVKLKKEYSKQNNYNTPCTRDSLFLHS